MSDGLTEDSCNIIISYWLWYYWLPLKSNDDFKYTTVIAGDAVNHKSTLVVEAFQWSVMKRNWHCSQRTISNQYCDAGDAVKHKSTSVIVVFKLSVVKIVKPLHGCLLCWRHFYLLNEYFSSSNLIFQVLYHHDHWTKHRYNWS